MDLDIVEKNGNCRAEAIYPDIILKFHLPAPDARQMRTSGEAGVILVEWELGLMWSHWHHAETELYFGQNLIVKGPTVVNSRQNLIFKI